MHKLFKYKFDLILLGCLIIFMMISVVCVSSASTYLPNYLGNLALKQFFWYLVGFGLIGLIIYFGNLTFYKSAWILYIANVLLLAVLLVIGTPVNGSKCWLMIPGIGTFQPSEFMKISLILLLATVVSKFFRDRQSPTMKEEFFLLLKCFLIIAVPSILTFLEPDTGVVFIYIIIAAIILFSSPLRKRWIFMIGGIVVSSFLLFLYLYFFQKEFFIELLGTDMFYRLDRLFDWRTGTGLQLENSLTAIGSSGLFGHGYNQTPIYFPESGTDFIFAVLASNFGLLGSIAFVIFIAFFDLHLIKIIRDSKHLTSKFLILGCLGMIVFQQVQNISMTLGLLPITGITLPFISYGGSSLLSYFLIMGLIFNIVNEDKSFYH